MSQGIRTYSTVCPRFWTGASVTGQEIRRQGPDASLVALYLMTAPLSSMLGLYYLPLPVLSHETGLPPERGVAALEHFRKIGFAHYDGDEQCVWVPEMARYQIAETLSPKDRRLPWIRRQLTHYEGSRFHPAFLERYGEAFHLPTADPGRERARRMDALLAAQEDDHGA